MSRILIVEDEEKIARFLELELGHEGYVTEKASDGIDAVDIAQREDFDIIILDIMLPSISGIEVLRRIRRTSDVPIILLTARDSVMDKVTGLDMGANDYITKPFAIEELLARIRVLLRKSGETPTEPPLVLSCCGVEINVPAREASYNGVPLDLTNREFILLHTLLENKNIVMSRDRLLTEAWGYDYLGETNIIDVYVRYLRQKTDDSVIKTVRGVGYIITDEEI
ncbi:MAG: response regulator transcription factor [Clostridia bacterium]|nr:response regulator transcription factor [Clostridia bacterium]